MEDKEAIEAKIKELEALQDEKYEALAKAHKVFVEMRKKTNPALRDLYNRLNEQ